MEPTTGSERSRDRRLQSGVTVHTKCNFVQADDECQRMFGSIWKTTYVEGVVIDSYKKSISGRSFKFVRAKFSVGPTKVVEREIQVGKLKLGHLPGRQVQQQSNQDSSGQNDILASSTHNSGMTPATSDRLLAHGLQWNEQEVNLPLNGAVPQKDCIVSGLGGIRISAGVAPRGWRPIQFFYQMFPLSHLGRMVRWTSENLNSSGKSSTSITELLRFFGIMVLMTRCQFSSRRDLWRKTSRYPLLPAINLGGSNHCEHLSYLVSSQNLRMV